MSIARGAFSISFAAAAMLLAIACGGQVKGDGAGGDDGGAGSNADASLQKTDGGANVLDATIGFDAANGCNQTPVIGGSVDLEQQIAMAPPLAGGKDIQDGLYELTAINIYIPNGPTGAVGTTNVSLSITVQAPDTFDFAAAITDANGKVDHTSSTATLTGPDQLTIVGYCPSTTEPTVVEYAFDGNTLTLRESSSGETLDEIYMLARMH